ncbi:efflux RND transporter periplasmic adaptor subunit [Granulosicoccus sp. 3-233]|uniref:efflux RND transporter periplasmic adaptor subunit n=1 Tax=Granulosicoccus sp. 3-233 TaxID=3417969 RepID=UPI003D35838C
MKSIDVPFPRASKVLAGSILVALLSANPAVVLAQNAPPPAAVSVMQVEPQSVLLTATLPGRVVAAAVAEVRPQVNGIITERNFTEGSAVEQGDVLYKIDSATYEATVAQARAAVAQAQAQYKATEREAERIQELKQRNVSTQRELDEAIAARDVSAAAIAVAEAQLKSAEIELDRTTIVAPLSGEIGLAMTTRGALVTAGQASPLATIRNIDTVYVDVTASASRVLEFRRNNLDVDWRNSERKVVLHLADGEIYPEQGLLTAAEPQVDMQTGVVVLRMEFPNPDKLLLPGTYVKVDLQTDEVDGAFVIPQQAVSRDRQGKPTALVVNDEDVVELRQLDVLQASGNDWIVRGGLAAGERIIMEGSQKAPPGSKVQAELVTDGAADAASDTAPEAAQ